MKIRLKALSVVGDDKRAAQYPAGDSKADRKAAHEARLWRERGVNAQVVYDPKSDSFIVATPAE